MKNDKAKSNTHTDVEFHVSYGGKSPAQRKTKILAQEDKALELFRQKEKDFHVSVERVEKTTTTRRTRLA